MSTLERLLTVLAVATLSACTQGIPAASVSTAKLEVASSIFAPAPVGVLKVVLAAEPTVTLGVHVQHTRVGLDHYAFGGQTTTTSEVLLYFRPPALLGLGTHQDQVTLEVCVDAQCTKQVPNSPLTVQVSYLVTSEPPLARTLVPSSASTGASSFAFQVLGSNFDQSSFVRWNGSPRPTSYLSSGQLSASLLADDLQTVQVAEVTVVNPGPGGGVSEPLVFTMRDGTSPGLLQLSPQVMGAGAPGFLLSVEGSKFNPASVVLWNGTPRPTTFVSSTLLTTPVEAAEVAAPKQVTVEVSNEATGGGSSLATFLVQDVPQIWRATPTSARVGDPPFTLSLAGWPFDSTAQVLWNGAPRPTTVLSYAVTVEVSAADLASEGVVSLVVSNGDSWGQASSPFIFQIGPPVPTGGAGSTDSVAFQLNPAHSGVVAFNPVTFPSSGAWRVDVGGLPSYPLIAAGHVFVTAATDGGSLVLALEQATGAVAWGPVSLAGLASAAYGHGMVYVVSAGPGATSLMTAFDALSGERRWSTSLDAPGLSGITASDELVYVSGGPGVPAAFAVGQGDGRVAWSGASAAGETGPAAVTSDGAYLSDGCSTLDLRLQDGAFAWRDLGSCPAVGGGIAVVANGLVYAPPRPGATAGRVLNADGGWLVGTYLADAPPAIGSEVGYFLLGGALSQVSLADSGVRWTLGSDAGLVTAPIVINQYAIVGGATGILHGIDGTTGEEVWTFDLGAPLARARSGPGSQAPLSGLAAGDGLLVVPAGTTLTAFTLAAP
jgi:outer membrane protein assembly factor BamB